MLGKKTTTTKKSKLEFTQSVRSHKPKVDNIVYEDELYEYVEVDESSPEFQQYEDVVEEYEIPEFYQGNFPEPTPPYFMPPPVVPQPTLVGAHLPPPPPPHPQFIPELRDEIEEYIEEEYVEEEYVEEEYVEEDEFSQGNDDVLLGEEFEKIEVTAAPISSMQSKESEQLLKLGERQEIEIKNGRFSLFLMTLLKWSVSLLIVIAMIAGCAYIVHRFFERDTSQENIVQTREAPVGNFSWRISEGRVRTCIEAFYMSIGVPKNYISANDILLKGNIKLNTTSDSIYCIKKRVDNKTFVKIGAGNTSKTYLVGTTNEGVFRLVQGGMSGEHRELDGESAWIIRSLIDFDDLIFVRAFSRDYHGNPDNSITYCGEYEIDGKYYQSLSLTELNGVNIKYFFDNKTNRLFKATYTYGKNIIDVLYSDYKNIDDEEFRPFKYKILLNSKLYAEINFDFIVKRDGLIFPN